MIKKFVLAALATAAMSGSANAGIIYMTGTSNPWGTTTNDLAMDAAFGAGNWTKVMGFTTSVFNASNSFVFVDGSDSLASSFDSFLTANPGVLNSYATAGGSVFANVASNNGPNAHNFGAGYSSNWTPSYSTASNSGALTAAGTSAGLGAGGAGTNWTGGYFSHNTVTGGTCYVSGSAGCVFSGGAVGAGAIFAGGQTTTNFHSPSSAAFQLRVNELTFAAGFSGAAVPEPATWAMMLGGFGLVGGAMRRRQKVSVTYA